MEMSFQQSETIADLASALSKAQAQIMKATKDSNNPFFKSKYADLTAVWDAVREPLTINGLAVTQFPLAEDALVTMLLHSSGQWMRSTYKMRPVKDDPQGRGSCLTYMRRYALMAVTGVCPEDDDGNAASNTKQRSDDSNALKEEVYHGHAHQKLVFARTAQKLGLKDREAMSKLSENIVGKIKVKEIETAIKEAMKEGL